jgi:oxygen-independent coproporphyrinogen-3 oxidase
LAIYSYAHWPEKLRNQRRIDASALPTGQDKYELFALARRMLVAGGYRAIGMDHFALPSDELSTAMDERRLHRNFMGYTVVPASEMLGIGASAIGEIGGCYAQNEKKLSGYEDAIEAGRFATHSGSVLTKDDIIRRWVIRQIMCNFYLDTAILTKKFGIQYSEYFGAEDKTLDEFVEQGFVTRDNGNLQVAPLGQVFIRNVAMVFDAYIKRPAGFKQFSRTV